MLLREQVVEKQVLESWIVPFQLGERIAQCRIPRIESIAHSGYA